jgi:hypothetical protein
VKVYIAYAYDGFERTDILGVFSMRQEAERLLPLDSLAVAHIIPVTINEPLTEHISYQETKER